MSEPSDSEESSSEEAAENLPVSALQDGQKGLDGLDPGSETREAIPSQFIHQIEMQQQSILDRTEIGNNQNLLDELLCEFPVITQPLAMEWDGTTMPFMNEMARISSATTMSSASTAATSAGADGHLLLPLPQPNASFSNLNGQQAEQFLKNTQSINFNQHHTPFQQSYLHQSQLQNFRRDDGAGLHERSPFSPAFPLPPISPQASGSEHMAGEKLLTPLEYAAMKLNQQQPLSQSPMPAISDAEIALLDGEDQM